MTTTTPAPAPTPLPVQESRPLGGSGLFTVLLGTALPMVDLCVVNVALPAVDRDLAAGHAVLELVVAGYGLSYAVLLVLGGRIGDRFGRRRLFLAGMIAFGVTSLLCGLAPGAWWLVAARVAQGAAAALMHPQALATIQSTTTGPRRARAMSLYGATGGLAMVVGQALGGLLLSADPVGLGWRSVFLVNVPVVLLGLALAVRSVPETRSGRAEPVDVPGTVLLTATLLALLTPLTVGGSAGWPPWTWVSLAAAPALGLLLLRVERAADRAGRCPLLAPSLLRLPSLRRGLAMVVPFSTGLSGFLFVLTLALQHGAGLGPLSAGLALVPMATAFCLVSLLGPRLAARFGTRAVTAGALLQWAGVALIVLAARRYWPDVTVLSLTPGALLAGAGQALQMPLLFRVILSEVPAQRAGVGSGLLVTTQQSATALGVACLGSLFLGLTPSLGMLDALTVTLGVQLVLVALNVALSLRLPAKAL